jgi:hypothetical protein
MAPADCITAAIAESMEAITILLILVPEELIFVLTRRTPIETGLLQYAINLFGNETKVLRVL